MRNMPIRFILPCMRTPSSKQTGHVLVRSIKVDRLHRHGSLTTNSSGSTVTIRKGLERMRERAKLVEYAPERPADTRLTQLH